MSDGVPARRPPDIPALLAALVAGEVRFVLTGSVAAMVHGVELTPGDLDVTPDLQPANLQRLIAVLDEVGARPESLGHWERSPDGERRWITEDDSPEALAAWRADPADPSTLDHLFLTQLGDLDVVPELVGRYDELAGKGVPRTAFGQQLLVAHVDDLLSWLTVPRREKDIERVRRLREIQGRPTG
jgi:hypothetical protein